MIGLILLLLLPTLTIWSSLNRKQQTVISGVRIKLKRSDSSYSDSVALMTPLTTPFFDFHKIISALYHSAYTVLTTPTLSLVKTTSCTWAVYTCGTNEPTIFFPKNLVP